MRNGGQRSEVGGRRGLVLEGMWAGKCTKEIAWELGISPKTVEFHRACLYRVFGVRDVVSLCRRAMEMGILRETLKRGNAEMLK